MEIAQLPVRESKVEALPFRRAILVTAEGLDVAREAAVLGRPFRSMALGVLGMQVVQHGIQVALVGQDPEEGHHAVQLPVVEVQLVPAEYNPAAGMPQVVCNDCASALQGDLPGKSPIPTV
jgi:hypothetical protein